jgi:hypothetical protein
MHKLINTTSWGRPLVQAVLLVGRVCAVCCEAQPWRYSLLLKTLLLSLLPALLLARALVPRPLQLSCTRLSQTLQAALRETPQANRQQQV